MNNKANKTSFMVGHKKSGGFSKGDKHSPESKAKVSLSLSGKFGADARRWKGMDASYVAKHMWIAKYYGKASLCENDPLHTSTRFEWANLSGTYQRGRDDYRQLCKRCHVAYDRKVFCRNGHLKNSENTYLTKHGWHACRQCRKAASLKWRRGK